MDNPHALKDFRCRNCKNAVAKTDGTDLFFGAVKVPGEPFWIKFPCGHCRHSVEWYSSRERTNLLTRRRERI